MDCLKQNSIIFITSYIQLLTRNQYIHRLLGMKSGGKIQPANKNSFAPSTFENQFLSDVDESESYRDSSVKLSKKDNISNNNSIKQEQGPIQKKGSFQVNFISVQQQKSQPKDKEQKIIKKANKHISKLSASIAQIKDQFNQFDMKDILFKKRNVQKQKQIKEFLKKKHKQKRQRQQKLQKIRQHEQRKRQQVLSLEQQSQSALKQARKPVSLITKEQRQRYRQQSKNKEEKVAQYYEKYKDYKRFHQKKQEQDRQIQQQKKEMYRQYLQKHKQQFAPLDWDQIDQYSKKHDEDIKQMNQIKKSQKQQEMLKIIEENNQLQQKVFRGISHEIVDQQLSAKKYKKKQPKQFYKKVKNYQKYVRQNFIPKTHQQRSQELDQSMLEKSNMTSRTHKEVKRYKYFQGVSYGQIVENRPLAKSQAEQRRMGNDYLHYLKSLPKKKTQKKQEFTSQKIAILNDKLNNMAKVKKEKNPLYDFSKRKSLDMKISQSPTRQQLSMVLVQLKGKDEKAKAREKIINSQRYGNEESLQQKRKEVNQQIIDNIERKLSLLSQL